MFVYSFNENQYLAELTFVLYIQFDIYAIKIYNVKFFIYAIYYFYISLIFFIVRFHFFSLICAFVLLFSNGLHASGEGRREREVVFQSQQASRHYYRYIY